jgi:hypothetical protein
MKHAFYTLLLAFGIFHVTALGQITTGVPDFISYQGKVLDSSGGLVGSGTPVNRTVTFRIWNHASNTLIENLIYSEEQTVTIAEGEFSVLVGQGVATSTPIGDSETDLGPPITSIADAFNGEARYLGVTIDDGTAAADNEISPRQQIVSSAFAFRSKYAEQLGTNNATALTVLDSGNVGIGTAAPSGRLQVKDTHVDIRTSDGTSGEWAKDGLTVNSSPDVGYSSMVVNSDHNSVTDRGIFDVKRQGVSQFYVRTDGNVGIGTTAPIAKLTVVNSTTGDTARFQRAGGHSSHIHHQGNGDIFWRSSSSVGKVILQDTGGNVGIGTSSPTQAKLVVSGVGGTENLGAHYTYSNTTGVIAAPGYYQGVGGISIKASDAVHAAFYRALSDARIKNIEGVSDGAADLGTLNRIEITNYTYKDVIGKGKDQTKKVIAQQVEKVFPEAVTKTIDVVPDIYKIARIVDGWIELATDLKKGERVRLIADKHDEIHEVLEVEKDRFLTAYRPDRNSDATPSGPAADAPKVDRKTSADAKGETSKGKNAAGVDQIFVFGREVNDFRVVDYDAIAMLNVSATRELARKVAELEALNAEKDKGLVAMRERVAELEAGEKARNERLVAIEKLLSAGKSSVIPVSLKTAAE